MQNNLWYCDVAWDVWNSFVTFPDGAKSDVVWCCSWFEIIYVITHRLVNVAVKSTSSMWLLHPAYRPQTPHRPVKCNCGNCVISVVSFENLTTIYLFQISVSHDWSEFSTGYQFSCETGVQCEPEPVGLDCDWLLGWVQWACWVDIVGCGGLYVWHSIASSAMHILIMKICISFLLCISVWHGLLWLM